ncbi:MAG: PAS domain S-box protein [Ignavibacteria bacterium]|nr:PAS domain S-box protein [Ignavibacteria bacterium]
MTPQTKPTEIVTQLRVLYLEDDPTYAGFVQTTLEAEGFSCDIDLVDNREDFVASLEDGGYDIILADFVLPSIDGFSALSIAQEKWPDIPFIIVSAYIGEENAIECLKAGATDYVGKQQLSKLGPAIRRARTEIEERRKRTQAEEALSKNEQRYRILFDLSPSGILLEDVDGNIIDVNWAFCNSFGYSQEELVGKNVRLFVPPESVDDVTKHISLILSRGTLEHEVTNVRKDGTLCYMELREKKILLPEGQDGILVVANDVTLRKRAEEAVQTQAQVLNNMIEGVNISDENAIIFFTNPAFDAMFGYERGELIGMHVSILNAGEPEENARVVEEVRGQLETVGFWRGEFKNIQKDGTLFTTQARISALEVSGRTCLVSVQEDITDRENAEAERKNLEAQLIQAQKIESLGTLASGIAHDFNNILGIILGHSTLLEQSADDSAQQSRSTQAINKAVQRGSNLVGQILTFARKTDVSFESVSVNEIITELARMFEDTFPKTIDILLELEKQIPYIEADRSQLHQTVLNLCINARDAMPEGGTLSMNTGKVGIVELRRTLPEAVGDRFVRVSVSDTGTGMDEATRRRIFEPFFTTKMPGKGTGLGLAVVFGIMKSHHGYLDVESEIGRGSSFHLYFPVAPRSTGASQSHDEHVYEVTGGSETLLLVEDEEMLRELVQNILQANGYKVLTASDGEEAVHLYEQHKHVIAAVISDVGLPKQSGGEVLSRLKEINPNVNVILASGYIEPEEKHRLLSLGATSFIQKPYVPQQILKQVREILDGT